MALIQCPECKKRISDNSESCTKCGFKFTAEKMAEVKAKDKKIKKIGKVGCLSVFAFFLIIYLIGAKTDTPKERTTVDVKEVINMGVESIKIKMVSGKYRYFFVIKNNDKKSFTGKVKIELMSKIGPVYDDTFAAENFQPDVSKVVYIDARTGPERIHADAGFLKFKYRAEKNDSLVAIGEGQIIDY